MQIEYEATFPNINKNEIRNKLKKIKAKLIKPEFTQKRTTFNLPKGHGKNGAWLRVRDEGDKITLTYKKIDGNKIENQKEINLEVDSYNDAVKLLSIIGCRKKSYQETKRELWSLDGVEIAIDEWPYLEPLVEVEGNSEAEVEKICGLIGLDYNKALFCCVTTLYNNKYGVSEEVINNKTPRITFKDKNPFIK